MYVGSETNWKVLEGFESGSKKIIPDPQHRWEEKL